MSRKNKAQLLQDARAILQALPDTTGSSYETLEKLTNKGLADWIKAAKEAKEAKEAPKKEEPAKEDGVSSTGVSSTGVSSTGVSSTGVSSTGVSSTGVSSTGVSSLAGSSLDGSSFFGSSLAGSSFFGSAIDAAVDDFAQYLQTNTDAKDYLAMCTMSGNAIVPGEMGEYERRSWLADMEAWIAAGRPKARMPEIPKGKVRVPIAIYRVRDQGKDKMMVKYADGSFDGREERTEYEKIEDPTTGDLVDSRTIKERYKVYTMHYTEKLILKYADEAAKLLKPHQKLTYYYIQNNEKVILNPANITKPHEELASAIAEKRSIS